MLTTSSILMKYAIPALFGSATKTYLDYKSKKVSAPTVVVSLIMNSIVAVGFGSFAAHAFVGEFPSKDHFGYAIEMASVLFLVASVYLVHGVVTRGDIEIIVMYAMFAGGMLLYVRPFFRSKKKIE